MSKEHDQGFDLDEDLFDFGGVGQEPEPAANEENLEEIFASFREDAAGEELLPGPGSGTAAATPSVAPPEAAEPARHAQPAARAEAPPPHAPARAAKPSAAPPAHVAEHAPEPVRVLAPAPSARFSRGVVAIALAVTTLNAALAVVMLRGSSDQHDVRATGDEHAPAPQSSEPAPAAAHVASLPDPESVPESHGHPTLDQAREELARGDHAAARQRVYGLLSIVDRLEDPRKGEIEAECHYLIAQSLHLEALARMGGHE